MKSDHDRVNDALRARGIEDPAELLRLIDAYDEQQTVTRDNVLAAAVMGLASQASYPLGLIARDACDIAEAVMEVRKRRGWS